MTIWLHGGKIQIVKEESPFSFGPFKIVLRTERHVQFDGTWSKEKTAVIFERRNAVAFLIHDTVLDKVALVEQFRPATYFTRATNGRIIEIPAGTINDGESAFECVRREAIEEVGVELDSVRIIFDFFTSPGANSERIFLFYAPVKSTKLVAAGGGLSEEGEDIRTHWVSRMSVKDMLKSGGIVDAKTIIALQWFLREG